jgi:hypothetical protein
MQELPPLEWFGPSWDAELCSLRPRVPTPVREHCVGCGTGITYSSQGIVSPESDEHGVRLMPWHLRCFRNSNATGADQV